MPSLCFTDLQLSQKDASDVAVVGDRTVNDRDHTALFVLEESKKSSYQLQASYALYPLYVQQVDKDGKTDSVSSSIAMASITSRSYNTDENTDESSTQTQEFLFGGFELLVNTKTVEVYVIRSGGNTINTVSKSEEETYLTTCKGVPQRDLPPLSATPCYVDGTEIDANESTEEEDITFYKFVFVSPGGPKPHLRVKLKFVRSNDTSMLPILIRTLKVKGRLSESITSTTNTSSNDKQSIQFGGANRNSNKPNNNMNSIASMMALMGGGNASSSMPMQMQMNHMQQMQTHTTQQHMYTQQQQQLHQQHDNHQQEKNQAELISSIAGLGMYLKSSEERSSNKLESLLLGMEERIMNRLNTLTQRLDVIEQSIQREQSNREEVVNEEQSNREEVDEEQIKEEE